MLPHPIPKTQAEGICEPNLGIVPFLQVAGFWPWTGLHPCKTVAPQPTQLPHKPHSLTVSDFFGHGSSITPSAGQNAAEGREMSLYNYTVLFCMVMQSFNSC